MQMVAVKPVARWQIWLGKWLGLLALNAALLAVSGGSVYGLLLWRARQLPEDQQRVLRNEIFVARASLKEPEPDIAGATERIFRERLQKVAVPAAEHQMVRDQIREQLEAGFQIVAPNYQRRWDIDLGFRKNVLRDQPLYLRVKFHAAQTNGSGSYLGLWQVGVPDKTPVWRDSRLQAADTFYEIEIPPNLFEPDGRLTITFVNGNPMALLFPIKGGFEVLYREGGFALNFARGLGILFCWLALLAALGLTAASLMSFPVAAFFSASLLVISLSSGTMTNVVTEGTVLGIDHETGAAAATWIDTMLVPIFKGILSVVNLVQNYSPVDALSTGRSITWGQLGTAFAQIVLLLGGFLAAVGMTLFTRRELATAQGHS